MENPKVSILVPIYNVEKYLPRCIESVLSQDFKAYELILVDDGSPDQCPQICDEYAKKDSRIKVVHKRNGGLVSARLAGFMEARGEYVMHVDSDDYLLPSAISTLYNEAKEMGCENVVCTGPTADVPGVMKDAAIFAFSSRFEGFGLVLTEANACSVPAVSYNCPVGPSEIVTDGVDGFLVESENVTQFAEKLIKLMKDDKLRAEMGVKAYESSKRFAMDKILKEWVELIEE